MAKGHGHEGIDFGIPLEEIFHVVLFEGLGEFGAMLLHAAGVTRGGSGGGGGGGGGHGGH